ncbi:MAG TPA: nucleoside monophosphate kinase [Patescibacteria group bacterium]|nr:nucleoside monophosphate kinase [Patescibacteria group bacterium]
MNQIYRIVLLGPQGSGKGTQGERLSHHLGIPTISVGALYREAIRRGDSVGLEAERFISEGMLVPNHLTSTLIENRLAQKDTLGGWILDAYPRSLEQLEHLLSFQPPTHVIALSISDEEAVERIANRLTCTGCERVYHKKFAPPKKEGFCDECGGPVLHRSDDTPEAIRRRLHIYHTETEPVLARLEMASILHRIDGTGPIDLVEKRVDAILDLLGVSPVYGPAKNSGRN